MSVRHMPQRFGAQMWHAFTRWLELVVNTATATFIAATVTLAVAIVGILAVGGTVDLDAVRHEFEELIGIDDPDEAVPNGARSAGTDDSASAALAESEHGGPAVV